MSKIPYNIVVSRTELAHADWPFDISVVIPSLHEAGNLQLLLPRLDAVLNALALHSQLIIVDNCPDEETIEVARTHQATLVDQQVPGYGAALRIGFDLTEAPFVLTLDADLSHPPDYIEEMWEKRERAEVLIASRYVKGGNAEMSLGRLVLSRILNVFFSRGLDLKVRDMSSGYRLYSRRCLQSLDLVGSGFEVLQEILVKAYCEGWRVFEVPFSYAPRRQGSSHTRVISFGLSYVRAFKSLYRLRNSILSADYDARAYSSIVLPQRLWQRQRFRFVTRLIEGEGAVLDVGAGSSRILRALPSGSVGVDILLRKLRYARGFGTMLVQGSAFYLPFGSASFPCVLCSQVIEHVPKSSPILDELDRLLEPGGPLVLGTPDYGRWEWRFTEAIYQRVLPSAYADEHISHYTRNELVNLFRKRGYALEEQRYVFRGELILKFRKNDSLPLK